MIDGWLAEWIGLFARWFHLTAGIAWIGASFYFVWLNNAVRPPESTDRQGVAGEVWSVHGGAFYRVEKYGGAPAKLPSVLHWFKWEAYLTWLSGFFLLVFVYWRNAATWMVDPAVADLTAWQAVGVGAGALVVGWLVYDGLCRSPLSKRPNALAALLLVLLTLAGWGLWQLLAPRAAFIHLGAMMGTAMAANVLFIIIPGQRAIVDALIAGAPPPLERGKAGSLRSLHNNYLTLGVLFAMISSHFPGTWGHSWGWLLFLGLTVSGAMLRHAINLSEQGRAVVWLAPGAVILAVAVAVAARPDPPPAAPDGEVAVSTAQVQQVIGARCLSCHSDQPFFPGIAEPPKGVVLQTPAQIEATADRIATQVASGAMPLGNATQITDDERALIARWAAARGQ